MRSPEDTQATVTTAATAFERRWTVLSLRRIDPDLERALREQRDLYFEASVHGSGRDIAEHGAALVRGFNAAIKRMEEAGAPDDAYLIGQHNNTVVAIGHQKAAADRVFELYGKRAILLSPDEVAMLFDSIEGLKSIAAIKQRFPGAEVLDRYPDEPAKLDGEEPPFDRDQ